MKKTILAVAAVALIAFVPAAQAKELVLTGVCGAAGCKAIKPAAVLGAHNMHPAQVPPLESYYVLRVGYGDGKKIFGRGEMYFVPATGALTGKDTGPTEGWLKLPAPAARAVAKATAKLRPFSAPVARTAYIGTRRVADASPFMPLLGPLEPATVPRSGESPISIGLEWAHSNPWSNAGSLLNYLPKARIVIRLDGYFRVPDRVADRIDRVRLGP